MTRETLKIEGMSCMHCVAAVKEALQKLEGVHVDDVQIGQATVSYEPEEVTRQEIDAAIEEEGYSVV